jgi:hypothetical protein
MWGVAQTRNGHLVGWPDHASVASVSLRTYARTPGGDIAETLKLRPRAVVAARLALC